MRGRHLIRTDFLELMHGSKVELPLVGKAEGLVDGERKSVALTPVKPSQRGGDRERVAGQGWRAGGGAIDG